MCGWARSQTEGVKMWVAMRKWKHKCAFKKPGSERERGLPDDPILMSLIPTSIFQKDYQETYILKLLLHTEAKHTRLSSKVNDQMFTKRLSSVVRWDRSI